MRAIILAAGMGTRLGDLTKDTPKCMMELHGTTLLERQIKNYQDTGYDEIIVVRGYLSSHITYPGVTYVENTNYANNGLLVSLFTASHLMDEGFVFSYADTTWRAEQAAKIKAHLEAKQGMAVVTDLSWKDIYEGRDQHPLSEAECVAVDDKGHVVRAGKVVGPDEAHGEVAGMGGVSKEAAAAFVQAYQQMIDGPQGLETVFGQKGALRHAYVVDLMLHIAAQNSIDFVPVPVHGGWREIDTPQDLERSREAVNW